MFRQFLLLIQIYPGGGPAGSGPTFKLPTQFTTDEVCRKYDLAVFDHGSDAGKTARKWLDDRGFNARAPPALMFSMWAHKVPGAMDIMNNISYDYLHCFNIGLLAYFLDLIILSILNSHAVTQKGYEAVGLFEARLSALPSFFTGYRLFRAYPGGCVRRAINSGNDNFYLVLMFIAAI